MSTGIDEARIVRVLKALADPRRFRMVQEIAEAGELTCGQLGEKFDLAQPTVSHHLRLLQEAQVVRMRQQGQHHIISVDRELLAEVATYLGQTLTSATKPPASQPRRSGEKAKP
jgi:ArsR family transcriptional regulator